MDIQRINQHTSAFNDITHYIESDNGKEKIEVWFARELQSVLGYVRWENFTIAIGRAVESCKSQNINVDDHFREVTKMISLAKGAKREVKDYMLTRFACYLIAQNGDPKKDTTEDMKLRLGIKSTRPLADFLPTLTIAAKNLATEMTNYNVEQKDGSPDKPRGLSIQPCKSEKEEPYICHSSQGRSECLYLRIE